MKFKIGDRVKKGSKVGTVNYISEFSPQLLIKWDNQSTKKGVYTKGTWNEEKNIKLA